MTADAIAALTAALDLHWMDWNAEQQTAVCSCGGWQFDADRDIVVGEHFAPFSRHVAEAIAALAPADPTAIYRDTNAGHAPLYPSTTEDGS